MSRHSKSWRDIQEQNRRDDRNAWIIYFCLLAIIIVIGAGAKASGAI